MLLNVTSMVPCTGGEANVVLLTDKVPASPLLILLVAAVLGLAILPLLTCKETIHRAQNKRLIMIIQR